MLAIYMLIACSLPASAAQAPSRVAAPITIRADASRISVTHPIAAGDRLSSIMLRYGVDDLRLFFENDLRFLAQFA